MQLFLVDIPNELDEETFVKLSSFLDEHAQERIIKFRLREDSIRSLVGRLAPIWYLHHSNLLSLRETPQFGRKGKGKPTLIIPALEPPLSFNTSHDGAYVLLGATRGKETDIGVDLMQLPSDAWDIQEAISEQLVQEEKSVLALPLSPLQRAKLITILWTFKEGYVKATGDGVGFGLERIHVDLDVQGAVHGVYVDGRDIQLDGWKFSHGWVKGTDGLEEYGWAVYWKAGQDGDWHGELERIPWEEFSKSLLLLPSDGP